MAKIDFDDAKSWVTSALTEHAHALTQALANRYGVGRSAAAAAIKKLEQAGLIQRTGPQNRPTFVMGANLTLMHSYSLSGMDAETVWQRDFAPWLTPSLSSVHADTVQAGFITMATNAALHSQGTSLHVILEQDADHIELTLHDNGIGIFKRLSQTKKIRDPLAAVEALADQCRSHPDSGIAAIEKSLDFFLIEANGVHYPAHAAPALLSTPEEELFEQGTTVIMELGIGTLAHTK